MERESEQLLTQHSVSEHSSTDSESVFPCNKNVGPRLLTQRSVVYLDSDSSEPVDFTPHSPSPSANVDDIRSQTIMESRPNSSPENSTRVPFSPLHRVLNWNTMS